VHSDSVLIAVFYDCRRHQRRSLRPLLNARKRIPPPNNLQVKPLDLLPTLATLQSSREKLYSLFALSPASLPQQFAG